MRAPTHLLVALALVSACGSFDNRPFATGFVRGQVTGADAQAFAAVVGHDELVTTLGEGGVFELRDVPLGPQDVLVVATPRRALRLAVEVAGGQAVELGVLEPKPTTHLELHVRAPGGQRVAGTVFLDGTPFSAVIRGGESEAEFNVPPGCYDARAVVSGLGTQSLSLCVPDGAQTVERTITMPAPDGSAGREGCPVSGCAGGLTCTANLSCE